jgi:hypothetical protein
LEGESGCGLTVLAELLVHALINQNNENLEVESFSPFYKALLGPESTVENLIGVFKPSLSGKEFVEIYDAICMCLIVARRIYQHSYIG